MSEREPRATAVALCYDGTGAPRVTAKGHGDIARRIIALAREHDVPLREEPELVRLLASVELGEQIPRELYVAVAQVIAFAYAVSGKRFPDPHTDQGAGPSDKRRT